MAFLSINEIKYITDIVTDYVAGDLKNLGRSSKIIFCCYGWNFTGKLLACILIFVPFIVVACYLLGLLMRLFDRASSQQ